ncbi:MAG: hypothetical protein KF752_20770 [Pirellulaceae bacterium]|nr:hypothetical protein [Pirellulaceae bacterium]
MILTKHNPAGTQLKRLLLGLSVQFTAGSVAASASAQQLPEVGIAQGTLADVPVYPFPPQAEPAVVSHKDSAIAKPQADRSQTVARWLGLSSSATKQPLSRPAPVVSSTAMLQLPLPQHLNELTAYSSNPSPHQAVGGSSLPAPVVPVAATANVVDPQDLLNSLDVAANPAAVESVPTPGEPLPESDSSSRSRWRDQTRTVPSSTVQSNKSDDPPIITSTPRAPESLTNESRSGRPTIVSPDSRPPQLVRSDRPVSVESFPANQSSRRQAAIQSKPTQPKDLDSSGVTASATTATSSLQRKPLTSLLVRPASADQPTDGLQRLEQADRRGQFAEAESTQVHGTSSQHGSPVGLGLHCSVKLKSEHTIEGLSVEHEDLCQAVQTGPNNYTLVGLREGSTRVAVISQNAGQSQVQIRQVTISRSGLNAVDLNKLVSDIRHIIGEMYPRSQIRIAIEEQQIIVSGVADSDQAARRVLELVRKTTLIPVVDRLTISLN